MLLLKKPYSQGDTISLKIMNGDEIIARFEEETDTTIKISKPLAINIGPQGLGMMPWMFLGDDSEVTLEKAHIFAIANSKKEASDQYIQSTTGIALR